MNISNNNYRIHFLDQCKGLGIILMVYGHCTTTEFLDRWYGLELFNCFFNSFHMPLFFIIGGWLLAYKKEQLTIPKTLTKKTYQLIVPGLFYSILSILLGLTLKLLSHQNYLLYLKDSVVDLLTLKFPDAMWFLPCYFFAEILFLLTIKRKQSKLLIATVCNVGFISVLVLDYFTNGFIRISRLLTAITFIAFGYLIYQLLFSKYFTYSSQNEKYDIKAYANNQKIIFAACGIILLVVTFIGSGYNKDVTVASANYGENKLLFLFNALFGSLGVMFIFNSIDKRIKALEFLGKNSLTILCTHMFIINLFWVLNSQVLHLELASINSALLAVFVLLTDVPVIFIITKYFPFLTGMKS